MKYKVIALLTGFLLVSTAHAEEAPMDATHLGLRAFVYNAFTGIKKAEDMPQFPKGHLLTKAELYNGVAAGVRVRGKNCNSVVEARALDANGSKISVKCAGGESYQVLPLTGEVKGK
ncbi:hypothetical protein [Acinetobacter seifertii]|uniref:hypothetical protein n=1 Tax=Acinetobacter seifertii TaxID=1530123 RepID=UPI0012503126|nr:hypothetical protein [Acinetobacter seifertii]